MSGRGLAVGLAAGLLACGAATGTGGAATRSRCVLPPHAHLIAQTAQARAWVVRSRRAGEPAIYSTWIACLRASGRRTRLASGDNYADSSTMLPALQLAADLIGYGVEKKGGLGGSIATVYVRDLRSGRVVYRHHAARTIDGLELFYRLALAPDGSLAWISANVTDAPTPEVWIRDGCGATLVDSGSGIRPRTLARSGRTASWIDGTARRSAQLAQPGGPC